MNHDTIKKRLDSRGDC